MKLIILTQLALVVQGFIAPITPLPSGKVMGRNGRIPSQRLQNSQLQVLPSAATSLIAGSIAGAVGVGAAYPLDTIKTHQQIKEDTCSEIDYVLSPTGEISIVACQEKGMIKSISDIWNTSGIAGFYGGVQTSMAGQAIIKATAFSVNAAAISDGFDLVYAAAIAGFVTAFLAVPVDRIKVLMQTNSFASEYDCFNAVVDKEGLQGLMLTGLVPTLFREVPAYTLYFYLYGMMMASAGDAFGSIAPAISGAVSGALCVVPVHPVDVVKTIVQHSATEWQEVVQNIYEGQGLEGFWEGLLPRMGRAAVNHSVTFAVYDALMHNWQTI